MTTWLDRIAADILHVESRLRVQLRDLSRITSWTPARPRTITLSVQDARTLLRGVMPAPIAVTNRRRPHARLVAALSVLHGQLIALNDPLRPPEPALAAAASAIDELRHWCRVMDWRRACRQANDAIGLANGPEGDWADLAPSALAGKARLGQRGRISDPDTLYATGALRESFEVDVSEPDAPRVVSTDPVAALMEFGTDTTPPRPVLAPAATRHAAEIAVHVQHQVGQAIRNALEGR